MCRCFFSISFACVQVFVSFQSAFVSFDHCCCCYARWMMRRSKIMEMTLKFMHIFVWGKTHLCTKKTKNQKRIMMAIQQTKRNQINQIQFTVNLSANILHRLYCWLSATFYTPVRFSFVNYKHENRETLDAFVRLLLLYVNIRIVIPCVASSSCCSSSWYRERKQQKRRTVCLTLFFRLVWSRSVPFACFSVQTR